MLECAYEWLGVERLLVGKGSGLPRCRYGGVGQILDKVLDYEVFTLRPLATIIKARHD
jgi:hypothetical protein